MRDAIDPKSSRARILALEARVKELDINLAIAEAEVAELDAAGEGDAKMIGHLRKVLSRYADHDRACDARGNSLYACTCGFVEMVDRLFPRRALEGSEQ